MIKMAEGSKICGVNLYNSEICRLCAEENPNGSNLYESSSDEVDIIKLINRYLPIRVDDDGKNPKWICPGCHLQVEATAQFFDLLIVGQEKLRYLIKNELAPTKIVPLPEKQVQSLLKIEVEKKSVFPVDHALAAEIEGLDKPKRKRGRPPRKLQNLEDPIQVDDVPEKPPLIEESDDELPEGKRRKRKIKIPTRLQEAVQGKELERIYAETGIIDKNERRRDDLYDEKLNGADGEENEVIGHLQGTDGTSLGDLVYISKKTGIKNRIRKGKTKYLCDICNKVFLFEYKYITHRLTHQNVRFECTECLERFPNRQLLSEHQEINKHLGEGLVETLNGTEQQCDDSLDAEKNQSNDQTDENVYKIECVADESNALVEKTPTKTKDFNCELCQKKFNFMGSLLYHNETKHNVGRVFVCSKCDKCFSHRLLLQRHQMVHSTERPFECNQCAATFKTKSNLRSHRFKHTGVKNHNCTQCDQKFAHRNSLMTHMRLHNGERPFECSVCQKRFAQNGNLKEHMRIHTGERPFKCTFCTKSFTTSSQCKNHIRKHKGERPFSCEYCEKKFMYLDVYKLHVRRHTGVKPYMCMLCPKAFADGWALRKHTRYHTGEKPYQCTFCGKRFSDASNLKKHKINNCMLRFKTDSDDKSTGGKQQLDDSDSSKIISVKILPDFALPDHVTDSNEANEQLVDDPSTCNLSTAIQYKEPNIGNETIPENEQIIYLTMDNLHVMENFQSDGQAQFVGNPSINNAEQLGQNQHQMIITMPDMNKKLNVLDSDGNINEIHQIGTGVGNNILFQLHTNPTATTDDQQVEQIGEEPNELEKNNVFNENQQIELITSDGQTVRLLNYGNPIDLDSDFII